MPKKGDKPSLTWKEAQSEHASLARKFPDRHYAKNTRKTAESWDKCPGCIARYRETGVTVDGRRP